MRDWDRGSSADTDRRQCRSVRSLTGKPTVTLLITPMELAGGGHIPYAETVNRMRLMDRSEFRSVIARRFREHAFLRSHDLDFVRIIYSPYSEVFEYRLRLSPEAPLILVKRRIGYDSAEGAARIATREFAALETLWKRASAALEGTLPRPVALFPELGAFVTEKLPGRNLRGILRREANLFTGPVLRTRLAGIARLLGGWLRKFHDSTLGKAEAHDSRQFMADVKSWLEQCFSGGMDRSAIEEILALSLRQSKKMDGKIVRTAAKHGDFIPVNILVDGYRIAVLDFEDFCECDAVYEDVGMFWGYLIFMKQSGYYCRDVIGVMMRHFMEGYGDLEYEELLNLHTVRAALNIAACQFRQGKEVRKSSGKLRQQQCRLLEMAHLLLE